MISSKENEILLNNEEPLSKEQTRQLVENNQANKKYKELLNFIENNIFHCSLPILDQLSIASKKFFEIAFSINLKERDTLIDQMAKYFSKLKSLKFINLLITYIQFIERVKTNIDNDYVNNDISFYHKDDIILEPFNISQNDFMIHIKSTTKEKFNFFTSYIEKEINKRENDIYYIFDLLIGNYETGNTLHINQKDKYLLTQKNIQYDINFNRFSNFDDIFEGNKIKNNLVHCESLIAKNFHLTKRNTTTFKETYNNFKNWLLNLKNDKIKKEIKEIIPFGSICQITQNIKSDLEITIITKNIRSYTKKEVEDYIFEIENELRKDDQNYMDINKRKTKRTYLINFKDKKTNVTIELVLNNIFGLLNGKLIRSYLLYDSRALILVNTIKDWSKSNKINSNVGGYLSSYCYTLMTIYFLQRIDPPILPILSSKDKLIDIKIEDKQYYLEEKLFNFCLTNIELSNKNCDSVIVLFLKWLIFYCYMFNEQKYCIDVSSKQEIFRKHEITYMNQFPDSNKRCIYCIIDMFDYTYNPAAYLTDEYKHEKIKRVIKRTIEQILNGDPLFLKNGEETEIDNDANSSNINVNIDN